MICPCEKLIFIERAHDYKISFNNRKNPQNLPRSEITCVIPIIETERN